jgi:hypothetical protein
MAEKLKAAAGSFERFMLPRLNSIDGELKAINTRIDSGNTRTDGVEKSINSLRSEPKAEIRAAATSQDAKIVALHVKVDQLHKDLDMDRRMTIMEAKLRELEKRP